MKSPTPDVADHLTAIPPQLPGDPRAAAVGRRGRLRRSGHRGQRGWRPAAREGRATAAPVAGTDGVEAAALGAARPRQPLHRGEGRRLGAGGIGRDAGDDLEVAGQIVGEGRAGARLAPAGAAPARRVHRPPEGRSGSQLQAHLEWLSHPPSGPVLRDRAAGPGAGAGGVRLPRRGRRHHEHRPTHAFGRRAARYLREQCTRDLGPWGPSGMRRRRSRWIAPRPGQTIAPPGLHLDRSAADQISLGHIQNPNLERGSTSSRSS